MLFTLQRYEFFSKSQLAVVTLAFATRCCLPYKGTNFSANHNPSAENSPSTTDVVYPTKVRIFQQITTNGDVQNVGALMLFTLQRYEFFSKSQHSKGLGLYALWCCLPYKGTNFSANHNSYKRFTYRSVDVVYPTKVRIFQQITTLMISLFIFYVMLFTLQRYEFFSKSQHNGMSKIKISRCCLPYKGTNFSANHN